MQQALEIWKVRCHVPRSLVLATWLGLLALGCSASQQAQAVAGAAP